MLSVTASVTDDLRAKPIQMFGVRHSGYCIFVAGFNGSLLKFRSRNSMVLAIALDHLAVGVKFEALVTRLAYPGSHAVSIDPLVDRVSDAVADGVISPARPFGGETPNASSARAISGPDFF